MVPFHPRFHVKTEPGSGMLCAQGFQNASSKSLRQGLSGAEVVQHMDDLKTKPLTKFQCTSYSRKLISTSIGLDIELFVQKAPKRYWDARGPRRLSGG